MARPTKTGISYFNIDCENDIKTKILIKKFSIKAYGFYVYILQQIYKENYYLKISKDEKEFLFLESGLEYSEAETIFNYFLDNDFFNKKIYLNHSVLTSKGIQERYLKIITDCKRNQQIKNYILINSEETPINSEETPINSEETPINSEEMQQKKVKEIIINNNKENKIINNTEQKKNDADVFSNSSDEILNPQPSKLDEFISDWNNVLKFNSIPLNPPQWIRDGIQKIIDIWDTEKIYIEIQKSDFLKGKNKIGSFWFNPENIKKTLAGNYSNEFYKNFNGKPSDYFTQKQYQKLSSAAVAKIDETEIESFKKIGW